jgi:hypothetical protein
MTLTSVILLSRLGEKVFYLLYDAHAVRAELTMAVFQSSI